MRIALIQQSALPDQRANLEKGLHSLDVAANHGAELACFAELSFERFYPQLPASPATLALAESVPGATTDRLSKKAREHRMVVVYNLFERDGERTFDTSPVLDADGALLGVTRMVHITDYECFHERGYYSPSELGAPVYSTRVGKIGVAICYDRHFPEYMRALCLKGAELVVVPQAGSVGEWPDGLFEAEMRVAAFQNGYFVALCNRVGREERLTFAGESFVCAPDGSVIARAESLKEQILYADVDFSRIASSHAHRLFLRDRRPSFEASSKCPSTQGRSTRSH